MLYSPGNVRWLNSFESLDSTCKKEIEQNPDFKKIMKERIAKFYEGAIKSELTIDVEAYKKLNTLAGIKIPKEKLQFIEKNKQHAKKRCGGKKEVDHRKRMPPIRDQGETEWCFGYVAADMASFETGKNISPRFLSLVNYQVQIKEAKWNSNYSDAEIKKLVASEMGKGRTELAFHRAQQHNGFCLEKHVPSTGIEDQDQNQDQDIAQMVSVFSDLDQNVRGKDPAQRSQLIDFFCREHSEVLAQHFPNGFGGDIFSALFGGAGFDSYLKFSLDQCPETIKVEERMQAGFGFREDGEDYPGEAIMDIDHALDHGGIISVSYHTDLLGVPNILNEEGLRGSHASSIIGRRWNEKDQRCQYLLRNSWGTDCEQYGKFANIECKDGNIWVYEDELDGHTYNTAVFKKHLRQNFN